MPSNHAPIGSQWLLPWPAWDRRLTAFLPALGHLEWLKVSGHWWRYISGGSYVLGDNPQYKARSQILVSAILNLIGPYSPQLAEGGFISDNPWLTSPLYAGTKAPEFFTQEGQRLGQ